MSMAQLRSQYDSRIKRGARVRYTGEPGAVHDGVIVGTRGPYLRVRFSTMAGGGIHTLHPTWEMEYLTAGGAQ